MGDSHVTGKRVMPLTCIRPAATMMVAGLIEEAMKIEIELTALRQRRQSQ